jgi:hypothetical protein
MDIVLSVGVFRVVASFDGARGKSSPRAFLALHEDKFRDLYGRSPDWAGGAPRRERRIIFHEDDVFYRPCVNSPAALRRGDGWRIRRRVV